MLTRQEKRELIEAYKPLVVSRNAIIAQAKQDGNKGLVKRLKSAQQHDWQTVGKLRKEIKEQCPQNQ